MTKSRSSVVSSFTIIKGSLIDETYAVFRDWDFDMSRTENLRRVREDNTIGASSTHWARDVAKVLNRRFDPAGRDRPLVDLAIAGCDRHVWRPLLLFHMTRDEFLVRDFLVNWLYPQFTQGAYRLHTDDVTKYLTSLSKKKGVEWSGKWTDSTTSRVASGLLRMATDFGLLTGTLHKEFASYHLSEESFIYLLHAMADQAVVLKPVVVLITDGIEQRIVRRGKRQAIDHHTRESLAGNVDACPKRLGAKKHRASILAKLFYQGPAWHVALAQHAVSVARDALVGGIEIAVGGAQCRGGEVHFPGGYFVHTGHCLAL